MNRSKPSRSITPSFTEYATKKTSTSRRFNDQFRAKLELLEDRNTPAVSLLFIDSQVTGAEKLIQAAAVDQIIWITPDEDGIRKICSTVSQFASVDSLHILSHGSQGELQLGRTNLNAESINGYAAPLQTLSDHLAGPRDILLYGCNVAQGEAGEEFVKQFARLTKADVAASNNVTGSSHQGGDWRLEVSAGTIETNVPFTPQRMREFKGKFGTVVAWGGNTFGESNVPAGLTNVVQVGGGESFSLALKSDGTVVAWGVNGSGETDVPAGLNNVRTIAAGYYHSLALKSDGTVVAWGNNGKGQTDVPIGLSGVIAIGAGAEYSIALKSDGTIVRWGRTIDEPDPTNLTGVVGIDAGWGHVMALINDGTVFSWGRNDFGQSDPPVGLANVMGVAGGIHHSLALKSDGTVNAWGSNGQGQTNVPASLSNVIAVDAGAYYSMVLKNDGNIECWGDNTSGEQNIPSGLSNVIGISAGPHHPLVVRNDAPQLDGSFSPTLPSILKTISLRPETPLRM